ncbi:MAG: hypothetical protein R6X02_35040 [Enhygromyxa sp.]
MLLGCKPELPPLEYRSDRAWVGSDVVEQVCGGTLARIDRELEQIESRLELPRTNAVVEVYILDDEASFIHCNRRSENCFRAERTIFVGSSSFERIIAHELVHARDYFHTKAPDTSYLFSEGLAVALAPSYCPRKFAEELTSDELLSVRSSHELRELQGYYLGGELVASLLETHGPAKVLAFMGEAKRTKRPSKIRGKYSEYFGSELDDDLFAHLREPEDITPEEFGCFGPQVLADPSGTRFTLHATLDCDAEDVQNSFMVDGGGYVEWILTLDEDQAGTYALVGEVPEWTVLTIEACRCVALRGTESRDTSSRSLRHLQPISSGSYRLRWFGQLDSDAVLDVELVRQ